MKKILILLFAVIIHAASYAQLKDWIMPGKNWTRTKTHTNSDGTFFWDITYYNGLGYPDQIINVGASENGTASIVTPVEYDCMMRSNPKTHLPFAVNSITGEKVASPQDRQLAFYTNLHGPNDGQYAYTTTTYDSALDRPVAQGNAGEVFQSAGRKREFAYAANKLADAVCRVDVDSRGQTFTVVGMYDNNLLYKNTTTDEDGRQTIVFSDKLGRTILSRALSDSGEQLDTYSCYDELDRPTLVITPLGAAQLSEKPRGTAISYTDTLVRDHCYYYIYDSHGNLAQKHIPGRLNDQYFVYDENQRLTASSDGNYNYYVGPLNGLIRTNYFEHTWDSYEYDVFGRITRQFAVKAIKKDAKTIGVVDPYLRTDTTLYAHYKYGAQFAYTAPPAGAEIFNGAVTLDACEDLYLRVDNSAIPSSSLQPSLDPNMLYMQSNNQIKSIYFICSDPQNANISYYYIPFHFADIAFRLPRAVSSRPDTYKIVSSVPAADKPAMTLSYRNKCLTNKYLLVNSKISSLWNASELDPSGGYIQYNGAINPAFFITKKEGVPTERYYYIPEGYETIVASIVAQAPAKAFEIVTSIPIPYREYLVEHKEIATGSPAVVHDKTNDLIVSGYTLNTKYMVTATNTGPRTFFIPNGYLSVAQSLCADPKTNNRFEIVRKAAVSNRGYILVHTDKVTSWGVSLDNKGDYLMPDGSINEKFYVATSPTNPNDKYYLLPLGYSFTPGLISNDPNKAYASAWSLPTSRYVPAVDQSVTPLPGINPTRPLPPYLAFVPNDMVAVSNLDSRLKGMKTYERLAVLPRPEGVAFVERAFYYDYKGRVVQQVELNANGGISRTSYRYDYLGNPLTVEEQVCAYYGQPTPDTKRTNFTYDTRGRVLTEAVRFNGGEVYTTDYLYDALGRLSVKKTNNVIVDSLKYNIQGWLTEQNNSHFRSRLRYYDPQNKQVPASYTGNIAEIEWQHGGDADKYTYGFHYDSFSRLESSRLSKNGVLDNSFEESGISYDANGNINYLERISDSYSQNMFHYTYAAGKLSEVFDECNPDISHDTPSQTLPAVSFSSNWDKNTSHYRPIPCNYLWARRVDARKEFGGNKYCYDVNGNMLYDGRRGLNVRYNHLNLVEKVMSAGTTLANYSYLSDGTKLGVRRGDVAEGFAYLGSMVYALRPDGSLIFESTTIPQGRLRGVTGSGGMSCEPQYFVTDHLGSVRAVVGSDGQVAERSDYYPLGGRWAMPDQAISDNRYQFNGKERQVTGGVNWLDYGARMYDDQIGRWLTQDPLAEKYPWLNPYVFCANNPIRFVDPDGRKLVDANGNLLWSNGGWTKQGNAPQNMILRTYLGELRKTPTGRRQFAKLVNNPTPTQVRFEKLLGKIYGNTKNEIDESGKLVSSIITIDPENNKAKARDNKITHPQAIASTAGHEIQHTDEKNIEMQNATEAMNPIPDDIDKNEEKDANAVGNQIIDEYKNPQPQNSGNNENANSPSMWDRVRDLFRFW